MSIFEPVSLDEILGEAVDRCDLKFLTAQQIFMLDAALCAAGDYGEVRLVVSKGCLRFVVMEKSYDAFKWKKGDGFGGDGREERP